MSPTSPKHARKTVRRSAVAATAVAAAATLTVATPATANAAPTGNPQVDAILAAAPLLPGGIPLATIPIIAPQINQGVAAWNQIPVLSGLIPVSNTSGPIVSTAQVPGAPAGWLGLGQQDTFTVGAPLGLGGLTSTTYGLVGLGPGLGVGSVGGNITNINGPLGSSLGLNTSLSAITAGGLTTWTPSLGLNATAPLGLGSASATIVPVKVTYGSNTFIVGLPAINLGLTTPLGGGNLVLNLGSIGFQNGQLVLVTPSISGAITTPLGGGTVGVTPGTITVGTGGLTVDAPDLTATANVLNTVTANVAVNGGGGSITPAGVSVTGPSGTGSVSTPVGSGTVAASTGSASAGSNGVSVTGPAASGSVTTPVGVSGGAAVSTGSATVATNGDTTVTGPKATGNVTTPAGSASGHVETGSATVSPSTGSASVTGPSGGVETSTAAGNHGVEADTGSATASSSGVSVTDTPSVDVH
ncbi:beta strand repeat-containing protein [Tsukamurella hominis]|uniref:beta strand repeat-containing protein n=1 Tax=Tsukamurella hominis TaxID=1970232 RepID=UPI0039EB6F12